MYHIFSTVFTKAGLGLARQLWILPSVLIANLFLFLVNGKKLRQDFDICNFRDFLASGRKCLREPARIKLTRGLPTPQDIPQGEKKKMTNPQASQKVTPSRFGHYISILLAFGKESNWFCLGGYVNQLPIIKVDMLLFCSSLQLPCLGLILVKRFFELTQRPSRSLDLASYVASWITQIQGHPPAIVRDSRLPFRTTYAKLDG